MRKYALHQRNAPDEETFVIKTSVEPILCRTVDPKVIWGVNSPPMTADPSAYTDTDIAKLIPLTPPALTDHTHSPDELIFATKAS